MRLRPLNIPRRLVSSSATTGVTRTSKMRLARGFLHNTMCSIKIHRNDEVTRCMLFYRGYICSIKFYEKTRGPKIARRRGDKRDADLRSLRRSRFVFCINLSGFLRTLECTRDFLPVVGIVRCLDRKTHCLISNFERQFPIFRSIIVFIII